MLINYYFGTNYETDFIKIFQTDTLVASLLSNFFHKKCYVCKSENTNKVTVCLYLHFNDLNYWLLNELVKYTGVVVSIYSDKSLLGFKKINTVFFI